MDVGAARRQIAVNLPEAGVETAAVAVAAATAGNATFTDGDESPDESERGSGDTGAAAATALDGTAAASALLAPAALRFAPALALGAALYAAQRFKVLHKPELKVRFISNICYQFCFITQKTDWRSDL